MVKMLPIIIGIFIVTNVSVRGCSIPSHPSEEKDCSFPHCHAFKKGDLVLFIGKENVTSYEDPKKYCLPYNGTIFVPRTEEDNKIWLEFIMMLYYKDNSFKKAWYPLFYHYEGETFYWVYDTRKSGNFLLFNNDVITNHHYNHLFTEQVLYYFHLCFLILFIANKILRIIIKVSKIVS
ncbi:hypothetical protein Avbf_12815 [Armadillidium vulgare]|nr:hypothetical protein Avbf_12815 [Armadillidium vulgare]